MSEQLKRDSILRMASGAIEEKVDYEVSRVIDNEMVPQIPGQLNMSGAEQEPPKILKFVASKICCIKMGGVIPLPRSHRKEVKQHDP